MIIEIDTERVGEAVPALLLLGLHNGYRVRKGLDWDVMEPPRKKSFISDAAGKAKSVVLTDGGQRKAARLFIQLFAARPLMDRTSSSRMG